MISNPQQPRLALILDFDAFIEDSAVFRSMLMYVMQIYDKYKPIYGNSNFELKLVCVADIA